MASEDARRLYAIGIGRRGHQDSSRQQQVAIALESTSNVLRQQLCVFSKHLLLSAHVSDVA